MVKQTLLNRLRYTELVYGRINKKLKTQLSKLEIEELLDQILRETEDLFFEKIGKNYYISNKQYKIRITVNSTSYSVITVDRL